MRYGPICWHLISKHRRGRAGVLSGNCRSHIGDQDVKAISKIPYLAHARSGASFTSFVPPAGRARWDARKVPGDRLRKGYVCTRDFDLGGALAADLIRGLDRRQHPRLVEQQTLIGVRGEESSVIRVEGP